MNSRTVRWALGRHLAGTALVTIAVAVAVLWQGHRLASHEADSAAAESVRATALAMVVPLTATDLSTDRAIGRVTDALADEVATDIAAGELASVHLWAWRPDGSAVIVWSSEPGAVGRVETTGDPVGLRGTTEVVVERVESDDYPGRDLVAPLYEAYAGFADRSGIPFVLEVYRPIHGYAEYRSQILADWLPLSIGGLLLLGLATMPLAVALARRVSAAEQARRRVSRDALSAAAAEHRRLAESLHDHPVQDLAAAALLIDLLKTEDLTPRGRDLLGRIADIVDTDVAHLRGLLDGGHHHGVEYDDLDAALRGWVDHVGLDPGTVSLDVEPQLDLARPEVSLAHQIGRELIRNVAKHAGASQVRVSVHTQGQQLFVSVHDNGRGFDPARAVGTGLRLARAAADSWGGDLHIATSAQHGTRVEVALPVAETAYLVDMKAER